MNDNNLMNLKHCFTLSILLIVTLFLSSCATNQSNQSIEPDIEPKEQMPVVIETKEPQVLYPDITVQVLSATVVTLPVIDEAVAPLSPPEASTVPVCLTP